MPRHYQKRLPPGPRSESPGLVTVQEEERARITRELHDQVGPELTSLLLELRVLEAFPPWGVAKQRASELRALVTGTLEDVRRIAFEMRPAALDDVGVVAALRRDVEVLSKNASFDATFPVHSADDLRLSGDADFVLIPRRARCDDKHSPARASEERQRCHPGAGERAPGHGR